MRMPREDKQADNSQVLALASIWMMFLAAGILVALGPPACALSNTCKNAVHIYLFHRSLTLTSDVGAALNMALLVTIGLAIGVPIATAALGALRGLWSGDVIALKGYCPSCGEEVYTFMRADNSGDSRQRTECHVCEHPLVFHAKVERSPSLIGKPWAYGRVYLARRSEDLAPPS